MVQVTTKIDRADPAVVKDLAALSAATIHEAQGVSDVLANARVARGLAVDLP